MPIRIVRNDITHMKVDAIVNAAKPSLLGGGGVDGAIHRAAGPKLLEECRTLGGCETGQAKLTDAYDLPCRYVIHTVGPVWNGGSFGEAEKLASCYRNSLALALEHGCETVAFPLISAGIYGYPKDRALRLAMDSIASFLMENDRSDDMTVYLVVYSRESVQLGHKLSAGLKEYIDDHYVDTHPYGRDRRGEENAVLNAPLLYDRIESGAFPAASEEDANESRPAPKASSLQKTPKASAPVPVQTPTAGAPQLSDVLRTLDESFQQMLFRMIDERGMTDAQCYKRANIDRKLFSKIRSDVHYKPSKKTAVALAVALELDLPQTRELLGKAGFALSHSSVFDVIIEYFIANRRYDVFEINEALFAYDQVTLG